MAYVISDECICCEACIENCPVEAISSSGERCFIDADACIDCGTCAACCPTGAAHGA